MPADGQGAYNGTFTTARTTIVDPSSRIGRQDVLICALLLGFCLFLFREIILFDHLLFGSDFVSGYLGYKGFLFNEIHKHHSIPFWNPYIFSGIPFWAHFESTIFYPLDVLFWILRPEKAYGYTMFVHLFLAGVFMHILARSFHISRRGSFVAAVVFVCNGFIMPTLHVGQMFRVQGYIWLPLILYFLNQAFTLRRTSFYTAMAGLFWGIQILAGSAQDPFYTCLAALVLFGCRVLGDRDAGAAAKQSAAMCLFFLIGAGIAAIQVVPAFELIGQSVRAVLDRYDLVSLGSYPLEGIVTAVMPHFFGNYVTGDYWVSDVPWSIPDYGLYVGILPVMLLVFISYRRSASGNLVLFAGGLALVAFVLALGSNTPVYKLTYHIPGFNRIRAPAKIIVLWVFALALLGGKGLDDLFERKARFLLARVTVVFGAVAAVGVLDVLCRMDQSLAWKFFSPFVLDQAIPEKMASASVTICGELHRLAVFSGLILLAILFLLRGMVSPRTGFLLLCLFLLIDVSYANKGAVPHNDGFYERVKEIKRGFDSNLGQDTSIFRVGSSDLPPNLEMFLGYQTVAGYTPLFPYRYYEYINRYFEGQLPEAWVWFSYKAREETILMDLLNVKYEVAYGRGQYAYRKTCLPRAFIVPDCRIVEKEAILEYITKHDFDPWRVVLLEQGARPSRHAEPAVRLKSREHSAKILLYRPDEIAVFTNASSPGYLVLSEMFYPGWKATVDGHPRPIMRGNYVFRVVQVPAGPHVVRFIFDPLSIKVGMGVTVFTVFIVICLTVYGLAGKTHPLERDEAPEQPAA